MPKLKGDITRRVAFEPSAAETPASSSEVTPGPSVAPGVRAAPGLVRDDLVRAAAGSSSPLNGVSAQPSAPRPATPATLAAPASFAAPATLATPASFAAPARPGGDGLLSAARCFAASDTVQPVLPAASVAAQLTAIGNAYAVGVDATAVRPFVDTPAQSVLDLLGEGLKSANLHDAVRAMRDRDATVLARSLPDNSVAALAAVSTRKTGSDLERASAILDAVMVDTEAGRRASDLMEQACVRGWLAFMSDPVERDAWFRNEGDWNPPITRFLRQDGPTDLHMVIDAACPGLAVRSMLSPVTESLGGGTQIISGGTRAAADDSTSFKHNGRDVYAAPARSSAARHAARPAQATGAALPTPIRSSVDSGAPVAGVRENVSDSEEAHLRRKHALSRESLRLAEIANATGALYDVALTQRTAKAAAALNQALRAAVEAGKRQRDDGSPVGLDTALEKPEVVSAIAQRFSDLKQALDGVRADRRPAALEALRNVHRKIEVFLNSPDDQP